MQPKILSLYRYYLMMRHQHSRFQHEMAEGNWAELMQAGPDYLPFLLRTDPPAIFLSLWHATLYVVIEGWQKAGLEDPRIDILLESPNVEALRLHRHGTFHYHEQLSPPTYSKLLESPDAVAWTQQLSDAFHAYFTAQRQRPEFRLAALNCG